MINHQFECPEVRNLCLECQKAKESRNKPCQKIKNLNTFCKNAIIADNTLAFFKKFIVDENTREMHEEIKNQFAERRAEEERWLKENGFCSD